MAALKDIKRKITAVQKTRQITRAMNMVAASRFKAAQTRMENFRPYAAKFMEVLNSLALRVDSESHPLLAVREPKRIRVICMTSDRGLCGGFNNNLIKATERFIREKTREGREVELIPIGRKGRDFFRKKAKIINARPDVFGKFDMSLAVRISGDVIPPSSTKSTTSSTFSTTSSSMSPSSDPPWPGFSPLPAIGRKEKGEPENLLDSIYEPSAQALLEKLLPMYVHVLIYRALVDTSAGENGARMAAMDNATRNCEDLIQNLTLKYNKVRQSAITAELMDIVGGTEALAKG